MSDRFSGLADRVARALLLAPDLDALQELYVSNPVADTSPELQRALLSMLSPERKRRATDSEFEGVKLPEFSEWAPAAWMKAGVVIVAASEAAAMTGDPPTTDFAFALLQWWLVQISAQVSEACGYA